MASGRVSKILISAIALLSELHLEMPRYQPVVFYQSGRCHLISVMCGEQGSIGVGHDWCAGNPW